MDGRRRTERVKNLLRNKHKRGFTPKKYPTVVEGRVRGSTKVVKGISAGNDFSGLRDMEQIWRVDSIPTDIG